VWSQVKAVLPLSIRQRVESLSTEILDRLEEIRVRQGRPLELITADRAGFISQSGRWTPDPASAFVPDREDCKKMLNLVSHHSLYALEEELRRGYVTLEGGHRIGLAGKVVVENGRVKHLREITGFNVRFARQVKGVARGIASLVLKKDRVENVLIVSPPQCGKTTLLRDLARLASTGLPGIPGRKIGLVDERSEIAGCVDGVPQLDVGSRTDVMDGCPKAEGMMMMIRSMSPDILVMDEIGRKEDSDAIHEAVYAGVHLFTTAHGRNLEEVCRRPILSQLIQESIFTRIIVLSRRKGPGTVEDVYDQRLTPVRRQVKVGC
jgi:stage III sporulation protein AA